MTTIRPNVLPQTPQASPSREADKMAAAKAFFAAAMGQAPASATAQPAPQSAAPAVNRMASAAGDAPEKILRPGSLLDIRV